jgi:ArsR family transcriptional regulator
MATTKLSSARAQPKTKQAPAKKVVAKKTVAKKAAKKSAMSTADAQSMDLMFDLAAETFRVMSALLEEIETTQPNMSQHLNTLFKAKILGRRREGVQIYYRIINDRVVTLCRAVCTQIAIDSDIAH